MTGSVSRVPWLPIRGVPSLPIRALLVGRMPRSAWGSAALIAPAWLMLALATAPPASAATPGHTDVMFVFDTSGSMSDALEEAKTEIQQVMSNISASLPNVNYGLAEVRDYGGSTYRRRISRRTVETRRPAHP